MGGGLMQLVAYGAQDIYLTGNPQITFFKVVYRRHTNFSMETIQQTINGDSTTAGGSGTVTISRNGDLVSSVYVTSSTTGIQQGSHMVNEVELEIGGQRIDRHYEEWNDTVYCYKETRDKLNTIAKEHYNKLDGVNQEQPEQQQEPQKPKTSDDIPF